eukprot:284815963_6
MQGPQLVPTVAVADHVLVGLERKYSVLSPHLEGVLHLLVQFSLDRPHKRNIPHVCCTYIPFSLLTLLSPRLDRLAFLCQPIGTLAHPHSLHCPPRLAATGGRRQPTSQCRQSGRKKIGRKSEAFCSQEAEWRTPLDRSPKEAPERRSYRWQHLQRSKSGQVPFGDAKGGRSRVSRSASRPREMFFLLPLVLYGNCGSAFAPQIQQIHGRCPHLHFRGPSVSRSKSLGSWAGILGSDWHEAVHPHQPPNVHPRSQVCFNLCIIFFQTNISTYEGNCRFFALSRQRVLCGDCALQV